MVDPVKSARSKKAWETIRANRKLKEKPKGGYNSNETGEFVKFLLWLNGKYICNSHDKSWGFGTSYPSDSQKFFGYRQDE